MQHENEHEDQGPKPRGIFNKIKPEEDRFEMWAKIAIALAVLMLVTYGVALLKLGKPSVVAHATIIPMLGMLTLPMAFWGLLRTLFQPPVIRRTRTIGFGALLVVGMLGNRPVMSAPVSTEDYATAVRFELPFNGRWVTLAGGQERETNYHATTAMMRWGYDFAPLVDGSRFEGDGSKLEQHHCFGAPVYAPAAGEVVRAVGSEVDQIPGEFDPVSVLGNHVILRVAEGEYLFLAHLKRGSLKVSGGDVVEAGQQVAECGNSGRTYTPHLHVHLQNSPEVPIAESLPLYFENYLADGEAVERGMPVGSPDVETQVGEIVERQEPWPAAEASAAADAEEAAEANEAAEAEEATEGEVADEAALADEQADEQVDEPADDAAE
ncbi:M23 family metallopeptidase [Lujinxingia vulgaris]|nr:M23 family metallopeptidase [Lujinxingia vulgaris]